jgi:ankyrin repeat protein
MKIEKICLYFLLFLFLSFSLLIPSYAGELMNSVVFHDIDAVKKLLDSGADVNERDQQSGSTPLIMASSYTGYEGMVKLLLSYDADPNIQDKIYGTTALIAAAGVSKEMVELLLAKGADIAITRFDGTSAFTSCISGILSETVNTDLASFLLSKGADVDEAPTSGPAEGYTCLMMAARNNRLELVKFLADNGANINAQAKDGSTALSLAKKENDKEMITLLIELGAR